MDLKIPKIKRSFKKEKLHIHPITSWKIVLCVAALLILASFAFSFNLFMQVNKELVVPAEEIKGQIKIVRKESIEKTLEYFSEREKKSAEILDSPSPVVDPSL